MKCSIQGCPGEYEERATVHTIQRGEALFVFEHVPADVCSVCGDTILKPETIRHLESLLKEKTKPEKLIPLYNYSRSF